MRFTNDYPEGIFDGGAGLSRGGKFRDPRTGEEIDLRIILNRIAANAAPDTPLATDLDALTTDYLIDGRPGFVQADNSSWRYNLASTASDTTGQLVRTPVGGVGRWLRTDMFFDWKIPVLFSNADATVIATVPVGFRLRPGIPFWEIIAAFTTAASGVAGISTSNAAGSTKGDLLGGSGLDAAATLITGFIGGTIGAKIGTQTPGLILIAGNTIRQDKTSTFSAGSGFVHIPCQQIAA